MTARGMIAERGRLLASACSGTVRIYSTVLSVRLSTRISYPAVSSGPKAGCPRRRMTAVARSPSRSRRAAPIWSWSISTSTSPLGELWLLNPV